MNSVANGKVLRQSPFKRVYVQSAAGDAGGAIGAAIFAWHRGAQVQPAAPTVGPPSLSVLDGDPLSGRQVMDHAYLGPSASDEEIGNLLEQRGAEIRDSGCDVAQVEDQGQFQVTAEAIARGEVVGGSRAVSNGDHVH